ncbi:MAG: CBS domain-containing protein [Smithellaceae bacterium]|nr:CBS domain-containing protein [Smithellaceae bacterium]
MYSTAKEMMTTQVQSIGPEESIQAATEVLAKYNISGLPVVDENRRVIGILSSSDIVKFSGQSHIINLVSSSGWVSPYTDVAAMTSLNKGFEMLGKKKVKEIMTRKVITVPEAAKADEVARILAKKKINRLPVTDPNGALVGIITRTDLISAMAKED